MPFFLRLQFFLLIAAVLLLGLAAALGNILETTGTLLFMAGIGNQSYQVFVDYAARINVVRPAQLDNSPSAAVIGDTLYFSDGAQMRRIWLDRAVIPVFAEWDAVENKIFLAYRRDNTAFFAYLDSTSEAIQVIWQYANFDLGFVAASPNRHYLLLREAGFVRPIPVPKPMLLLDTETFAVRNLGSPVFAYWSPDSQYLALGYKDSEQFESRVQRYTVATGEILDYGLYATQEDTPFFYTNGFRSNGLLWSPDSQNLVILNRDSESLYFVTAEGDVLELNGGRIVPLRWSPDSQLLLGIGFANGAVGAFIVDSKTGAIQQLQSPILLQDALSDFAWSPNSRYVAVLTHSSGVLFDQRIALYDTQGQLVGNPLLLEFDRNMASLDGTLRWAN